MATGKIIIVSAPSGTGKSTIIKRIIGDSDLNLSFSVSATSRSPRTGETDGVDYHFLTEEEFREGISRGDFVEYEEVYPGRLYGTLKSEVSRVVDSGRNLILDIGVCGGLNVKRLYPNALALFIMPPSVATLRTRLEQRNTDTKEAIDGRVAKAEYEMTFADSYDCRVVNDDLEKAVEQTRALIKEYISR